MTSAASPRPTQERRAFSQLAINSLPLRRQGEDSVKSGTSPCDDGEDDAISSIDLRVERHAADEHSRHAYSEAPYTPVNQRSKSHFALRYSPVDDAAVAPSASEPIGDMSSTRTTADVEVARPVLRSRNTSSLGGATLPLGHGGNRHFSLAQTIPDIE